MLASAGTKKYDGVVFAISSFDRAEWDEEATRRRADGWAVREIVLVCGENERELTFEQFEALCRGDD